MEYLKEKIPEAGILNYIKTYSNKFLKIKKYNDIFFNDFVNDPFKKYSNPQFIYNEDKTIDWDLTAEKLILSEKTIIENKDSFNWDIICRHQILSYYLIKTCIDNIQWDYVIYYHHVDEHIYDLYIDKFTERDIEFISLHAENLSIDFLEKHFDKVNINTMIKHRKLSIPAMIKYDSDGYDISTNIHTGNFAETPEYLIQKYKYNIYWEYIAGNHVIKSDYLKIFINKLRNIDYGHMCGPSVGLMDIIYEKQNGYHTRTLMGKLHDCY